MAYKTVMAALVSAYLLTRSVEVTALAGGLALVAMLVIRRP